MKILILANYGLGLYKFRKELIERLLQENEVCISLPNGDFVPQLVSMGCKFEETEFNRRGMNPFADLKLLQRYKSLIKKKNPDIVLTYTVKPNVYGGIACHLLNKPCIANITGLGTTIENPGLLQKIVLSLYKLGLKSNKHIFFQNKSNRDLFVNKGITKEVKSSIIPGSGVNLDENSFEKYPEADSPIRFIFIGRIMRDKGVNELIDAAKIIKQKYPKILFDLIGPCDEKYDEILETLSRDHIINYVGYQSDVHPYITNSWAVVLPSYHEGTANVLLEAAATGRPVIASRVTGCVETYDDGISGLGCEARDVDSLVDGIIKFIELPYEQKVMMGVNGRRKVEREYDRNIVINAYINAIYKTM